MRVVKVGAGWCPACNQYQPTFDGIKQSMGFQHPDIKWEDWNADVVDVSPYGISTIPVTMFINDDDMVIDRIGGNIDAATLVKFVIDGKARAKEVEQEEAVEVDV